MTAAIVLDVAPADEEATSWVYFRGGAHPFDVEADALAFVVRLQTAEPGRDVEVRVR